MATVDNAGQLQFVSSALIIICFGLVLYIMWRPQIERWRDKQAAARIGRQMRYHAEQADNVFNMTAEQMTQVKKE